MLNASVAGKILSPYLRFEIEVGYLPLVSKGQSVSFVSEKLFKKKNLSQFHDYWIFDDKIAFGMKYDKQGRFVEAVEIPANEIVKLYQGLKMESVPINDVVKKMRCAPIYVQL